MAKLGKGVAAIQAKAEGGSGAGTKARRKSTAFTPLFRAPKSGDDVFVQFLTDLEDVEEVALHTFVKIPSRQPEKRQFDFEVFASRTRNERFGDDYSVLEAEMDHWPEIKFAGIAILLDPVYNGGTKLANIERFDVVGNTVERDGQSVFYPSWQLVYMSSNTFWANLLQIHKNYGTTEYPLQVNRTGSGRETKYHFLPVTHTPKLDIESMSEWIPTIDELIDSLGSTERYDEYFGPGKQRLKQYQEYPPFTKPEVTEPVASAQEEVEVVSSTPSKAPKSKISFDDIEAMTHDDEAAAETEAY